MDKLNDFMAGTSSAAAGAPHRETVPSYGTYIADDLYSDVYPDNPFSNTQNNDISNIQSDHNDFSDPPPPHTSRSPSPPTPPQIQHQSPVPPSPKPLVIVLDKDLIFPHPPPSDALYSLSYTLTSSGSSLTLRRSIPPPPQQLRPATRPDGTLRLPRRAKPPTDKDLYDILRTPLTPTSFTLTGKRRSTFPGMGDLRFVAKRLSLSGKGSWECSFGGGKGVVLRSKAGSREWCDGGERLVARELSSGTGSKANANDGGLENGLELMLGTDQMLMDLMVTCWVAKMWFIQTMEFTASTTAGDRQIRRDQRRK